MNIFWIIPCVMLMCLAMLYGFDENLYMVEKTIKEKLQEVGEDDGICKVIYFDETFNGVLGNTNTPDLIACYLGEDGNISFSAHSHDDNEETFPISFEELPRKVQRQVFDYIEKY